MREGCESEVNPFMNNIYTLPALIKDCQVKVSAGDLKHIAKKFSLSNQQMQNCC